MKKLLLPALVAVLLFSSCSKKFYAPALFEHDMSYQPKPTSFDSSKTARYISIGGGFNQAVNIDDAVSFAELNISQAHVFKNTNLSYGAYGFVGGIENENYQNETKTPYSFSSKGFAGIGGRASFNFYTISGNTNFRFFGIEASYSKEYGDFAAYRRMVSNVPDYQAITNTEMLTLGATTEVTWHSRYNPKIQHALRGLIGKTLGDYTSVRVTKDTGMPSDLQIYLAASYYLKINNIWGAAELTQTDYGIPGMRIKFGYKF